MTIRHLERNLARPAQLGERNPEICAPRSDLIQSARSRLRAQPGGVQLMMGNQMSRYLVQLNFVSFVKFNSVAFCCANTLLSPFNALLYFQSDDIATGFLVLFLAPFAGLLFGALIGILGFPLYKFLISRSQSLAAVSGRFQDISDDAAGGDAQIAAKPSVDADSKDVSKD